MPKTILVADDSVTIRKVVELTFLDTDIRVEAAANGHEALERLEAVRPDAVLADVVMPGPDGYELCRAIKASNRPVPVLLLSGTFEAFDEDRARDLGADGHVRKPFESRALLARIREILDLPAPAPTQPPVAGEPEPPAVGVADFLDGFTGPPVASGPALAPDRGALDILLGDAVEPVEGDAAPVAASPTAASPGEALPLSPAQMEILVRAVVERLSDRVVREIAWDVVPDLAEAIVRERVRQLEREDADATS
jgi:CheY-like chemotaxis protein